MTTLEEKINLALRWIASEDNYERLGIENQIENILKETGEKPKTVSVDDVINNFLLEIGIPPHIKGFRYIACGIKLVLDEGIGVIDRMTKRLYPDIAKKFDTTPARVERAIRHAVEAACDNGLLDHHEQLFGHYVGSNKGKPVNSAFIATCVMEVERRMTEVRV